jgi:hypothetical protein
MTELQKLAKLEDDGPFNPPDLSAEDRKRLAGAAKQWSRKTFTQYDYSGSSAIAEAE